LLQLRLYANNSIRWLLLPRALQYPAPDGSRYRLRASVAPSPSVIL